MGNKPASKIAAIPKPLSINAAKTIKQEPKPLAARVSNLVVDEKHATDTLSLFESPRRMRQQLEKKPGIPWDRLDGNPYIEEFFEKPPEK